MISVYTFRNGSSYSPISGCVISEKPMTFGKAIDIAKKNNMGYLRSVDGNICKVIYIEYEKTKKDLKKLLGEIKKLKEENKNLKDLRRLHDLQ